MKFIDVDPSDPTRPGIRIWIHVRPVYNDQLWLDVIFARAKYVVQRNGVTGSHMVAPTTL